jgi:hypothetical protein
MDGRDKPGHDDVAALIVRNQNIHRLVLEVLGSINICKAG